MITQRRQSTRECQPATVRDLTSLDALANLLTGLSVPGTQAQIEAHAVTLLTHDLETRHPMIRYEGLGPWFVPLARTAWVHQVFKRETSCAQATDDLRRHTPLVWHLVKGIGLDEEQINIAHELAGSAAIHRDAALAALAAITATGARAPSSLQQLLPLHADGRLVGILDRAFTTGGRAIEIARQYNQF